MPAALINAIAVSAFKGGPGGGKATRARAKMTLEILNSSAAALIQLVSKYGIAGEHGKYIIQLEEVYTANEVPREGTAALRNAVSCGSVLPIVAEDSTREKP